MTDPTPKPPKDDRLVELGTLKPGEWGADIKLPLLQIDKVLVTDSRRDTAWEDVRVVSASGHEYRLPHGTLVRPVKEGGR